MLRQRKKKVTKIKSNKSISSNSEIASALKKQPAPISPSSKAARSPFFSKVLDFVGIRPIRPNALPTAQQRNAIILDIFIAILILAIALATRFYRLELPQTIVFDEIHFVNFVDHYIKGNYVFDIHPPLGKLTLSAVAKMAGYNNTDFKFDRLGMPYDDLIYYPQRALSAVAGSFVPSIAYLTARSLSLSFAPSIATAAMPLFDILLCIESRLVLIDAQLIFFMQAAYLAAFLLWQTPRSTPRRYKLLTITAFMAACAISTKWTAFVVPISIAFVSFTGILFPHSRLDPVEILIAAAIAVVVYMGTFFIHFAVLPSSGSGDAFMPREFLATLVGSRFYDPNAPKISFWSNFKYLNWEMLRANSAITTRHPWESKWYEWLYNGRGILYSEIPQLDGSIERVFVVVNPVLTVVSTAGVIASVLYAIVKINQLVGVALKWSTVLSNEGSNTKRKSEPGKGGGQVATKEAAKGLALVWRNVRLLIFLLVMWCANLLPYIGVTRCTFLYHVLPALQLASLMSGIMLNCLPSARGLRAVLCFAVVIAMAATFYHFRPYVYAFQRTEQELASLKWMPGWK